MAGHEVALITDSHFGVRNGSKIFHDYMEDFYQNVFFKTLKERGIDKVIHLGDCFDNRKAVDSWSIDWAKRVFFDKLYDNDITVDIIVGNHDSFYKNTLSVNSPKILLGEYENVYVFTKPCYVGVQGHRCLYVPWVCEDNSGDLYNQLRNPDAAEYCFGHFEFAGFSANANFICEHGLNSDLFNHKRVFSGHFHHRHSNKNVHYLGNPYQLNWNDHGDVRGFHIFDLDSNKLEFIPNPVSMFEKITYGKTQEDLTQYKNKYIKLTVRESTNRDKLNKYISDLYDVGIHDLKIIELFDETHIEEDLEVESVSTQTLIRNYVEALEIEVNKDSVISIMNDLYKESSEV
jgi:DNA repair exonuclease SbcCD nuclease subunit